MQQLASRRPSWSRIPLLAAKLAELENDPKQAIAKYREAIALGENRPEVRGWLIEAYKREQRFDDIEAVMREVADDLPVRGTLGREKAELALRKRDFPQAADRASLPARV